MNKYTTYWLPKILAILTLIFFVHYVFKHIHAIPLIQLNSKTVLIFAFSILLIMLGIFLAGWVWQLLLKDSNTKMSFIHAQIIFSISQFGKYLPGNVGQFLGRFMMAKKMGISNWVVANTMLIEIIWTLAVAIFLGSLSLLIYQADWIDFLPRWNFLGALCFGITMLSSPWIGIYLLNRYFSHLLYRISGIKKLSAPKFITAFRVILLLTTCFLIIGSVLKLQAEFLFHSDKVNLFEITCLFPLAWLSGYIIPGSPAGIGIREVMMVLILSPILGPGIATGLSLSLRITTVIAELLSLLLGVYLKHKFPLKLIR